MKKTHLPIMEAKTGIEGETVDDGESGNKIPF